MNHQILFSGIPGKMCAEVLSLAYQTTYYREAIYPSALTGKAEHTAFQVEELTLSLVPPQQRNAHPWPTNLIAVDYSLPDAALGNIDFFISNNIPFVMGTTGFDRDKAVRKVEAGRVPAVIAPNMGIPIILIQRALSQLAQEFPEALSGYKIQITESHQSTKKDTSGTAKALVADFQQLGLPASVQGIEQVRDPNRQQNEFNVPPEHLHGHAYHYYTVHSPDNSVTLGLSHCINGRRVYAEGTLKALEFLMRKVEDQVGGVCYSMEDVISSLS
ncbi:MAG: dihydrodipicolinate reductase C-terminal domain-containing protein [Sumerlaeia bacterium]